MPRSPFPLGHLSPNALMKAYPNECAVLGAMTIIWNQLERGLFELFRRLSGAPKEHAEILFFSTPNHKARRDLVESLIFRTVSDQSCREWMLEALAAIKRAADKRNYIIHSEYFADIADPTHNFMTNTTPRSRKSATEIRHKIFNQIADCCEAIKDAWFYMEFAFAATHGPEPLKETLATYEPALRERRERKRAQNPQKDAP